MCLFIAFTYALSVRPALALMHAQAETPEVTTYVGTNGFIRLNAPSHAPSSVTVAVVGVSLLCEFQ